MRNACVYNDVKFPCRLFARTIHQLYSISSSSELIFSLTKTRKNKNFFAMVSLVVLYNICCSWIRDRNIFYGKGDRAVCFFAVISYGASRFLCKNFSSPPAMSYNKFCSVPKSLFSNSSNFVGIAGLSFVLENNSTHCQLCEQCFC